MAMVMAVSFTRYGRLHYLDPGQHSPKVGDKVLVPTDDGPEVAECVWAPQWVSDDVDGLPVCAGMADDDDLARQQARRKREAEVRVAVKRLIRKHDLPMKVVGVDQASASGQLTAYFSAPQRVDFRAMARELNRTVDARVHLHQLSPREEARQQGGIGPCGRELCCATFLRDFEPVTVRMAKEQDMPVNPLRISGACGRLMCCLKYEHPLYQEFKADLPARGGTVSTPEGEGALVDYNVPSDQVVVRLAANGSTCSCTRANVCGSRRAFEQARSDGARSTPDAL